MAWIESHRDLPDHPKTRQLGKLLRIRLPQTLGHLHLLWYWALAYAPNGRIWDATPELVAEAARWTGDPQRFWLAMIQSGFLEVDGEKVLIHDWLDYAGRLETQRLSRLEKRRESNRISQQHHRERLSANGQHAVSKMSATTKPDLTGPNLTGPNHPPMPPHDVSADALHDGVCCDLARATNGAHHSNGCAAA